MTQEVPQVDLDHPWVEASLVSAPRPVAVDGKVEAYEIEAKGSKMDVGLMTFITPVGVFNFYMSPNALGMFTMQCAEVMDQITAPQQERPSLVLADENMMRQEAERQRIAESLRSKS